MKKYLNLLFVAVIGLFVLASCKDDKKSGDPCYTCEISFFGISTTSDFCDDGTNMTTVTNTVLGISADTVVNVTAIQYMNSLELAGYTCTEQ